MPSLADVQERVRDTILGADSAALKGVIADDRLGSAARLNVYRNNTTILLGDALGATFPIVRALVGEDFFANMTRAFVRTHPPQSPCLHEYGDGFATFIEQFPGARALAYLPDVARLEWAINAGLYAKNAAPLDPGHMAEVEGADYGRLTFTPHPALRVVTSDHPVHAIWAMHQPGAPTDAHIDLNAGGEAVLVTRPGEDVQIAKLTRPEAAFIQALAHGETLGEAFTACPPGFDPAHALTILLNQGAFTATALK